jgi:putative transposase
MRFAFIKEHRGRWPVVLMCRVLRVSRNGFYDYARRPRNHSKHARRREELAPKIVRVHAENRQVYGSPRTAGSSSGHATAPLVAGRSAPTTWPAAGT